MCGRAHIITVSRDTLVGTTTSRRGRRCRTVLLLRLADRRSSFSIICVEQLQQQNVPFDLADCFLRID
jgi:hypothetical protein